MTECSHCGVADASKCEARIDDLTDAHALMDRGPYTDEEADFLLAHLGPATPLTIDQARDLIALAQEFKA